MGEGKGGGRQMESPGNLARRMLGPGAITSRGRLAPRLNTAANRRRLSRAGVRFEAGTGLVIGR